MTQEPIVIGGVEVRPGTRRRINIPIAELPIGAPLHLPVIVLHGKHPGPTVWVSAALHGDELNGVEIVRSLLEVTRARELHGTLIAVPVVNVYGFLNESRYLPDRRDLNRHFPGKANGSLASRLARLFIDEIVSHCDYGIDLHTGSDHRTNLPQVRCNLEDEQTRALALAMRAPLTIHASRREGTLRKAATRKGIPVIVYEAGEPMRFDNEAIDIGRRGILRALAHLGMRELLDEERHDPERYTCYVSTKSSWVRAKRSGLMRHERAVGDLVEKGDKLGIIEDILDARYRTIKATRSGMIMGALVNPMVYQGDAIIHVATVEPLEALEPGDPGDP
jgi:hypothetical protein